MTARVLDGQALATRMQEEIKPQVRSSSANMAGRPGWVSCSLATIRHHRFTFATKSKPGDVGFRVDLERMRESATLGDVLALVERLNESPVHDGILVQSPLPKAMGAGAQQRVFDTIAADKDVDGFGAESAGLLSQNRPKLVACTPAGVIELLEREKIRSAAAMPL